MAVTADTDQETAVLMNSRTRITAVAGLVLAVTAAGAGAAHATAVYVPGGPACATTALTADAAVRAAATTTRALTVAGLRRSAYDDRAAVLADRDQDMKEVERTLSLANRAAAALTDPAKAAAARDEAALISEISRANICHATTNDTANIATDLAVHTQKANASYYQRVSAAAGRPGQIRCATVVSAAADAYDRTMARIDRSYDIRVRAADAAATARLGLTTQPPVREAILLDWFTSRGDIEAARTTNYRNAKARFDEGLRDGAAASR